MPLPSGVALYTSCRQLGLCSSKQGESRRRCACGRPCALLPRQAGVRQEDGAAVEIVQDTVVGPCAHNVALHIV